MRPLDGLQKDKFYLSFCGALQNAVHYIKQLGCIKEKSLIQPILFFSYRVLLPIPHRSTLGSSRKSALDDRRA